MYVFTIIFVAMTYARNEDAKYNHKSTNLDLMLKYCKKMMMKEHGVAAVNSKKLDEMYEFTCQHYLEEKISGPKTSFYQEMSDPNTYSDQKIEHIDDTIIYKRRVTPITIFYVNYMYNQYLRKVLPNETIKILTNVEPMFLKDMDISFDSALDLIKHRDAKYYFVLQINSAYFCGLGPIFAASYFILFYVRERTTLFRFIQRIAGLNTGIYWLVAFIMDYAMFLTVLIVYFSMNIVIGIELFSSMEQIEGLIIVALIFPFAILPITYLLAFIFEHSTYAYIWTLVGYVFFGK